MELTHILKKHKVKRIDIIGNNHNEDTKFHQLYEAIVSGNASDDASAANILYGSSVNDNSRTFNRLKNRLKRRLINTLFFIDTNQPQFTDIQKAHYSCSKNWLAVRILLSFGARRTGISLAERTIRFAVHFEFTELVLYLSKDLRFHYSVVSPNDAKYDEFSALVNQSHRNLEAETAAEKHYTLLMRNYSRSQGRPTKETILSASESSRHLKEAYADITTFKYIRISYLVHVTYYQMDQDYESAIMACNEAIELFDNKPYHSQAARFTFQLRLLSCYIQLKKFNEGQELTNSFINTINVGSVNWYITLFYYFLLSSHSSNYQQCHTIMTEALSHKKFKTLYANHKQMWHVNQAYVAFLVTIGRIQEDNNSVEVPKFRLYKFLNNVPIYSKDKRGINVSILIVHVLLLLADRRTTEIIDRVDALNQYCHRYLKRDDTFRSNCFIKMLLQMARADFNRVRTLRYAEKYINKLQSMPLDVASQGIEVEIIPYETLWEMAVDLLD